MRFKPTLLALYAALLVLFAAGCGGGGGNAGGTAKAGSVAVYATDSLSTDFDHVWVKVYQVYLEGQTNELVFEDAAGLDMDLTTLRDVAGPRYAFLDDNGVTPATYGQVRVVMDEELMLVPKGATTAQSYRFAAQHAVSGTPGRSELKLRSPSVIIPGKNELVLDFDLSTWDLDANNRVVATLKRGNRNGLDDENRHEANDIHGTVSGLAGTSPNQMFTLTRPGGDVKVKTSADTRVFNSSGATNPVLANGQRVEVYGVFVQGFFLARAVKVEDDSSSNDPHKIKGNPSNINAAAGTFDVQVTLARGFVPDSTTMSVTTNATTRFLTDAGALITKDEFFAALAIPGNKVEVEGRANGSLFAAVKAKIEDENDVNESEIKGPVTVVDAAAGTLTMTVQSWFGTGFSAGQSVDVTTKISTEYRLNSDPVTKDQFFAGISVGTIVEAKGSYNGTVLSAIRLKDDD